MDTIEYRTEDKASWPRGPWDDEPDKMQWQDEATGLACLIVRNIGGALCGYVGLPEGHPAFGKHYDDVDAEVHGGLTFSDRCRASPGGESSGICHVPGEGEPDHVWWLGFDCAGAWDAMPAYKCGCGPETVYRDIAYVQGQVRSLAQQLKACAP